MGRHSPPYFFFFLKKEEYPFPNEEKKKKKVKRGKKGVIFFNMFMENLIFKRKKQENVFSLLKNYVIIGFGLKF